MAPLNSPPPGGDRSRGYQLTAAHAGMLGISTVLLFARLFTRFFILKNLGLDDLFVVIGVLFSVAGLVFDALEVPKGVGRHIFYLRQNQHSLEQLIEATKYEHINEINIILGTMFIRLSIAVLLLRIFGLGTKKWWRWGLYSIMVVVVVISITFSVLILAQCRPLTRIWDPSVHGSCWSSEIMNAINIYNSAILVLCDWVLASLPVVFVWKLQMSLKLKAGICILMGMGFFSGVCAIVRTVLLKNLASSDFTWDTITLDIWATLELHVGIVATCIPTLKPLFNPSARYSWGKKGWSRRLTDDSAQPHSEDSHRLHNFSLRKTVSTVPPEGPLHSYDGNAGRNHVTILGGRPKLDFGDDSRYGPGGGGTEGITKKTEFSLDTRGDDDEARGWSR